MRWNLFFAKSINIQCFSNFCMFLCYLQFLRCYFNKLPLFSTCNFLSQNDLILFGNLRHTAGHLQTRNPEIFRVFVIKSEIGWYFHFNFYLLLKTTEFSVKSLNIQCTVNLLLWSRNLYGIVFYLERYDYIFWEPYNCVP